MRVIEAKRLSVDPAAFIGRKPTAAEVGEVIDEDTLLLVDGKPKLCYVRMPRDAVNEMRRVVHTTDYQVSNRVEGIPTKSSVFGAMPRSGTRCDFCRLTKATTREAENFATVLRFRDLVSDVYRRHFPEEYEAAMGEVTGRVHDDWRIGESPFLTCNVNVNFAIPYHKDAGNMPAAFSNVIIIRDGVAGGELVCPEFGISLSQRDGAMTIFDGRGIIHGVRPIQYLRPDAYRASIVYYTMQGMGLCLSRAGELERIQNLRTTKERTPNEVRKAKVAEINKRVLERKSR